MELIVPYTGQVPSIETIQKTIFDQARAGTSYNPGVPAALANLIAAQAAHETNGFTSNAFVQDKNAIGYKRYDGSLYQVGGGIASSEGDPYGHYQRYQDSVKELIDWIYRRQKEGVFPADLNAIQTPEQYAYYLKRAQYFGDAESNYSAGIRRWFSQYSTGIAGAAILVISFISVLIIKQLKKAQ